MKNGLKSTLSDSIKKPSIVKNLSKTSMMLFLIVFSSSLLGQTHQWKRTNPGGGGWFSSIGASKSGIVLAGSDLSGAYRSKNGGRSWDVIGPSRGLPQTHIGGMGFHRTNGDIMFLASGGIYKTDDGGDSWKQVFEGGGYVTDIEFATNKPWIGYASRHKGNWNTTNAEIYRTTSTGNNWTRVDTNLPKLRIIKMVVNPKNANELYLLSGKGRPVCTVADVYKSTDGGKTWKNMTARNNFEGFTEVADLAIDPKTPNTLYITTVKGDCKERFWRDGLNSKLYKSTNGGQSWKKIQDQGGLIFIDPRNTSKVTTIEISAVADWNPRSGTRVSNDGGKNFEKISDVGKWETTFHGETQGTYGGTGDGYARTIGEDLSNPANLYWTNSQWVMGSKDGGKNFKVLHAKQVRPGFWQSTGVDNVNMVDVDINDGDKNIIYTSWYDIGFWRSLDRGRSWQSCNNDKHGWGKGKGGNSFSVVSDPSRTNVVWTAMSPNQRANDPTYLLKSTDKGHRDSWEESNKGLPKKKISGLSLNTKSPRTKRILYVTADGDVYKSTNDGENWSKVYDCNGCRFTAVDRFDGNVVYAGGEAGLKRSTNAGRTWKDVSHAEMKGKNGIGFWDFKKYTGVHDILTDPNNKNWVYVAAKGERKGLYRSTDQGRTWKKLLTDDYMRKVAVAPIDSKIIYATSSSAVHSGGYKATSNGILFSNDGGNSWKKQNQGMAYPFAMAIDIDNTNTPKVIVGSPGPGFQMANVPLGKNPPPGVQDGVQEVDIKVNGIYTIKNMSNGQNIIAPQWDKHNARMYSSKKVFGDHKWKFEHLGNGLHHIKSVGTGRYLEAFGAKCENGTNINTWTSGNANHHKWYVTKVGSSHFIRPAHCKSKALDKSLGDDGNVKLWSYSKSNTNQKFELMPVGNTREGNIAKLADFGAIEIYPNPAQEELWLDLSAYSESSIRYTIMTPMGNEVAHGKFDASHGSNESIDLDQLRAGMYIIRILAEGENGHDKKFFISK